MRLTVGFLELNDIAIATNQLTDQPTNQRTQPVTEVLCRSLKAHKSKLFGNDSTRQSDWRGDDRRRFENNIVISHIECLPGGNAQRGKTKLEITKQEKNTILSV